MHEVKKGKVSLFIHRTKVAGDAAICLSLNLKVNSCCLNRLCNSWSCDKHPTGEELVCAAYAMYLNVNNLLSGDPVAMKSSKVGSTKCGSHNNRFFITWKVKGTVSAVRKSIGIALKGLVPGKLYSTYQQVVRSIGCKPNRAHFNYVAQEIMSAINSGVSCGVVGNVNLGKTSSDQKNKMNKMINVLVKKLKPGEVKTPKSKPLNGEKCDHQAVMLKVKGWAAYAVKDYVMSKAKGVVPLICNDCVMINMKSHNWESLRKKLKKSVTDHIKSRYGKVGSELGPVMAYLAIANSDVSCVDLKSLLTSKITPSQVSSACNLAL